MTRQPKYGALQGIRVLATLAAVGAVLSMMTGSGHASEVCAPQEAESIAEVCADADEGSTNGSVGPVLVCTPVDCSGAGWGASAHAGGGGFEVLTNAQALGTCLGAFCPPGAEAGAWTEPDGTPVECSHIHTAGNIHSACNWIGADGGGGYTAIGPGCSLEQGGLRILCGLTFGDWSIAGTEAGGADYVTGCPFTAYVAAGMGLVCGARFDSISAAADEDALRVSTDQGGTLAVIVSPAYLAYAGAVYVGSGSGVLTAGLGGVAWAGSASHCGLIADTAACAGGTATAGTGSGEPALDATMRLDAESECARLTIDAGGVSQEPCP